MNVRNVVTSGHQEQTTQENAQTAKVECGTNEYFIVAEYAYANTNITMPEF